MQKRLLWEEKKPLANGRHDTAKCPECLAGREHVTAVAVLTEAQPHEENHYVYPVALGLVPGERRLPGDLIQGLDGTVRHATKGPAAALKLVTAAAK